MYVCMYEYTRIAYVIKNKDERWNTGQKFVLMYQTS